MKTLGAILVALGTLLTLALTLAPVKPPPPYTAHPVKFTQPPRQTAVLWIGDSYPAGAGAASADKAYPVLVAAGLGWLLGRDAQGGTGFIADGRSNQASFSPLGTRVDDNEATWRADIVVVDAGRNDGTQTPERLVPAVRRYLALISDAYPKARLVLVVPQFLQPGDPETFQAVAREYRAWARDHKGTVVIDPLADDWLTSEAAASRLRATDGVHPNDDGHAWYAEHFAAAFRDAGLA